MTDPTRHPDAGEEHPDLVRIREQEAAAVARGYTAGDVNHNIQPAIGMIRLKRHQGEPVDDKLLDYALAAMVRACDAETAMLAERKAATRAAEGAPQVARVGHDTLSSVDFDNGWDAAVPVHVWHLLRRYTANDMVSAHRDTPPTGWLYTGAGARRLDDVLAAMWACPESDAMRNVPHGSEQYREPNLTILEQAQLAMDVLWAEFLDLPTADQKDQS